jgi:osmoprotectant transport system permease protein
MIATTVNNGFSGVFPFMGDNMHLLLRTTGEHLVISGWAILIALIIAVPLGLWLGHIHRGSFIAINVSNIGRALPSLAIIAICLAFIGVGDTITIVALIVLAVPPILTNAYVAVDGVDRDAVDAARGMGMRGHQILLRVELPLAAPLLFAGIRTAAVYVVATATLGAVAGSGGLGSIIVNQAAYGFSGVLAAAIWVAVLALLTEAVFAGFQYLATPRGLRRRRIPLKIGNARRIPTAVEIETTEGTTA